MAQGLYKVLVLISKQQQNPNNAACFNDSPKEFIDRNQHCKGKVVPVL